MQKNKSAQILSVLAVPFLVLSVFLGFFAVKNAKNSAADLPDYGKAPAFIFTDQNGNEFNSEALAGKPWIASFMFTRCPDACPRMTLQLGKFAEKIPKMSFISFTSDPENDKPEVLKEFISRGVGPRNWIFLTGDKSKLQETAAGFTTALSDNPGLHSSKFILVDAAGKIRGFYDSQSRDQMMALAVDARGLLN